MKETTLGRYVLMKKNKWLFIVALSTIMVSACQQDDQQSSPDDSNPSNEQQEQTEDQPTPDDSNQAEDEDEPADEEEEVFDEETMSLPTEYFNDIEEVDGQAIIQNPDNILTFVNHDFLLPSDYEPEDLVIPDVKFSYGHQDIPKSYMREEAAGALEALFAAANEEDIELAAVSGYRSYDRQQELYDQAVSKSGPDQEFVANPGSSEHQSGLAMDVSSASVNYSLVQEYEDTKEGQWLSENAHHFGFIIRYQRDKEDITGYGYEPWHLRYVGEAAIEIYENQLALEEFFDLVKEI